MTASKKNQQCLGFLFRGCRTRKISEIKAKPHFSKIPDHTPRHTSLFPETYVHKGYTKRGYTIPKPRKLKISAHHLADVVGVAASRPKSDVDKFPRILRVSFEVSLLVIGRHLCACVIGENGVVGRGGQSPRKVGKGYI